MTKQEEKPKYRVFDGITYACSPYGLNPVDKSILRHFLKKARRGGIPLRPRQEMFGLHQLRERAIANAR